MEPTVTPEVIGILAVGATVIGLLLTFRRDARTDNQALRAEFRADNQRLREEVHAGMESLRTEFRADIQSLRTEVRADFAQVRSDLADLRKGVQALTERTSRVEGVIEGLFAGRDRHTDAA